VESETSKLSDVVLTWAEALNARDMATLTALYASDAIGHDLRSRRVHGRTAIIQTLKEEYSRHPDILLDVVHVAEDGEWAILEWKLKRHGRADRSAAVGNRLPDDQQGFLFFHIYKGEIVFQCGY
jgi:ketosteroid isomerase-like protein